MYARIYSDHIAWPYTLDRLRQDEAGTSFPAQITPALLAEFGVVSVSVDPEPTTDHLSDAVRQDPVQVDGQWVQHWSLETCDSDRSAQKLSQRQAVVREERNRLMAETDWTQGKDIPDTVSDLWTSYRQALRDIPQQSGFPWQVIWPQPPV
jgi:hypothetical protein